MAGANNFSGNYLILRPQDVSVCRLFHILWNHELEHKAFIDYPEGKEENLSRRWLILMSLLGQKTLQSLAKPLARFGSLFETWLNLWSCNPNLFVLLLNALRGRVVIPDKTSVNFVSFVGYLDKRVKLDENIKPGDDARYYGALCIMAAKLCYENKAFIQTVVNHHWNMEFLEYFSFWNDYHRKHTTEAFMFHDRNPDTDMIVVAFRGTQFFNADDWCTDLDISWYEFPGMGKIHGGFMKALGLQMNNGWPPEIQQDNTCRPLAYYTIREKLRQILTLKCNRRTRFILTGHSLGGALAVLFPAVLGLHEETWLLDRLEGVYTFGQPRVGDEEFKKFMESLLQKHGFRYLRYVYCNDVIPRLPNDDSTFLFKHFGTCLYYNSFYKGKIVEEEPDKNYFSPLAGIPRMLNAFWELMRSFLLPHTKGEDYTESWLLKLVRFAGLALPGLSAHNPQDYVNATRLGAPVIYESIDKNFSILMNTPDEQY